MRTPEQIAAIVDGLKNEYPLADCTLDYNQAWELLVGVRLAAQCTDERVNMVLPALFEKYPNAAAMALAQPEHVEPYIRSCGFYHGKARDIVAAARMLTEEFGGRVPDTMEELLRLPGVGRKSANLILGDVYNVPGSVVVDTHCIRLSNRMGLVDDMKDPVKIEMALRQLLPPEECSDFCHRIVYHGRAVCNARSPRCEECCVKGVCQHYEPQKGDT